MSVVLTTRKQDYQYNVSYFKTSINRPSIKPLLYKLLFLLNPSYVIINSSFADTLELMDLPLKLTSFFNMTEFTGNILLQNYTDTRDEPEFFTESNLANWFSSYVQFRSGGP